MKNIKNKVLAMVLVCTMIFSCFSAVGDMQRVEADDSATVLELAYRWGTDSLIQFNTNLPATTPIANFLTTDNGCNISQGGDQNVGWIGMADADGTVVLTFNFGSAFTEGQTYVLSAGSVFGFTDGNTYTLDKNYTCTYSDSSWEMVSETAESSTMELTYRWGTDSLIQFNTNLPATTPIANFLTTDNGCNISQGGDQNVGWIGMADADGTVVLTFNFGSAFTEGQTYVLSAGSVFGFTDGNTYTLDKNYTFTYNGRESWSMAVTESDTVIVDGEEKEVVGRVELTPGYTTGTLIQFTDVYDFGFTEDNSAITFSGEVLLDGVAQDTVEVLGYTSPATTICFNNIAHEGKILTIKKDSVLYVDEKAVVIAQDFCAVWENGAWKLLDSAKEYIKVDGVTKEVVGRVTLTEGYSTGSLVQFTNVYDFGFTADNSAIQFSGTLTLDGVEQDTVNIVGYTSPTATICLNIAHEGKVLAIAKDSVLYVDDQAVIIEETFEKIYTNGVWSAPPEPTDGTFGFTKIHSGANFYLQVLSDLPVGSAGGTFDVNTEGYTWLMGDTSFTSGSYHDIDGQLLFSFNLDSSSISDGTTIEFKKGTIVSVVEGSYELDRDYIFTYSSGSWSMERGKLESPDSAVIADANGDGELDSRDLIRILRVIAGDCDANNQADLNVDENVDLADVQYVRYLILNPADDSADVALADFNFTGGDDFVTFADLPDDWSDADNITAYQELGMNTALVTNDYYPVNYLHSTTVGTAQSGYANAFNMDEGAHYVPGNLVQFKTTLPSTIAEGLYSLDTTNQIGTLQSDTISIAVSEGVAYAAFSFGRYPNSGEKFILKAGTTFAADGTSYTLDRDYEVTLTNNYLLSIDNLNNAGLDVWIRNHANTSSYFDDKWNILLTKKDVIDGFYLFDESFQSEFADMGTTAASISSQFPNTYLHANHVPISSYDHYGDGTAMSADGYKAFLTDYVNSVVKNAANVSGASLSYDNYPFFVEQGTHTVTSSWWGLVNTKKDFPGIAEDYLLNLQTAADVAKTNKANNYLSDFSICIQTFKAYNDVDVDYNPGRDIAKKEEITFQLYTGMAFGANMFEYFSYKSQSSGAIYNAILDDDGNVRTELYNMVKAANQETLCFADMINTFTWQGTNTIAGTTEGEGFEQKWNQSAFDSISSMVLSDADNGVLSSYTAEHDAIVGCFTKGQRDGYMVVNYNDPTVVTGDNTVSLTFDGCTKARIYVSDGSKLSTQVVTLTNGTYTCDVAPGSAFFIIPA